jgi:asparagine synthase (glutamine-hydrolysing)
LFHGCLIKIINKIGNSVCGILAVYTKTELEKNKFEQALKKIEHRGPDNTSYWNSTDKKVFMGHTRLSIIDISRDGNQPMFNETKDIVLVCNGEIYNFKSLRENLVEKGHKFKSKSDSEVILHAYEEWGDDFIDKLEGMFAFVLWDEKKERFIFARDGIGIKPLYYYKDDNSIIFSSELDPIIELTNQKLKLSIKGLSYLLSICHVPAPYTIWENIYKLEPGHMGIFSKNNMIFEKKEYWSPTSKINYKNKSDVDELLKKIVDEQLISDVPVGLFLSGGLDSTSLAFASTLINKKINPLTLGFKNNQLNEVSIAKEVTDKLGLNHQVKILSVDDINFLIEKCSSKIDEPILFSSLMTTEAISKKANEKYKTMLSGMGGDEVFGGYGWQKSKFASIYINKAYFEFKSLFYMIKEKLSFSDSFLMSYLKRTCTRFTLYKLYKLMPKSKNIFNSRDLIKPFKKYYSKDLPIMRRIQKLDLMIFCSSINLSIMDKAGMWNSLEVRVPFLDRRLVDYGISRPINKNEYSEKNSKSILRKFLKGNVPNDVLNMKKRGFRMLNMEYLDFEVYKEEVFNSYFVKNNLWNKDYINKIFSKRDSAKIYSLIFLSKWIKKYDLKICDEQY